MPATFFPGALCCPPGPVEGKAGPSQKTAAKQGTKNHQKTIKKPSKAFRHQLFGVLFLLWLKGVAYNMLSKNLEGRFDLSPILDFGSLERPGNGWPLHVINIHKQVVHTDVHKIELYIVH